MSQKDVGFDKATSSQLSEAILLYVYVRHGDGTGFPECQSCEASAKALTTRYGSRLVEVYRYFRLVESQ